MFIAILIFAYGMDGTTGQSMYNQPDESGNAVDDHSLFTVTMSPLQMTTKYGEILWENPAPQSIRSVRPIMLEFAKEKPDYVAAINQDLTEQIENLEFFEFSSNGNSIKVQCSFYETMIDGKVLNVLTETSSTQSCPVCHSTPSFFNVLDREDFPTPDVALRYGCQPLHASINIVGCLLHVSYRKGICVWQAKTPDQKQSVKERKKIVQDILLEKFNARVDVPKQGGGGSSTTGSMCRKLLSEPKKLALALGLDEKLVKYLAAIVVIINSIEQVDIADFDKLCEVTFKMYVNLYSWYPMPATLHKILVHSTRIMASLPLSTGFMGEQGSEARNKCYRNDRQFHARKISRTANITDVFYRAMDSSDPILAARSARKRKDTPKKDLIECLRDLEFDWFEVYMGYDTEVYD